MIKNLPRFRTALVIDDEEIDLFLVENIIADNHIAHNIIFYSNARLALSYLENIKDEQEFPDLIVLDLNMPTFSGEDFLISYHQFLPMAIRKNTKLVVLTAYKNFHEARFITPDRFPALVKIIEKPLQVDELIEI